MNAKQREYLITEVQKNARAQSEQLREKMPKAPPSLSNYMLSRVMARDFEIISNEEIREIIYQKAINATKDGWLGHSNTHSRHFDEGNERTIEFDLTKFFKIPAEYTERLNKYRAEKKIIQDQIDSLDAQLKMLVHRITLASDKTLQAMINEVDNMGDLTLMETTIKLLN